MEIISRFLFLMCELWNLLQHHSISDVPSYNLAVLSPCYYMVQRCGLSVGSLSTAYHNHWRGALVWACVHPMRPGQLKIPCTIAQCCVHWLSHNLWWPSYQSPLPVLAANWWGPQGPHQFAAVGMMLCVRTTNRLIWLWRMFWYSTKTTRVGGTREPFVGSMPSWHAI